MREGEVRKGERCVLSYASFFGAQPVLVVEVRIRVTIKVKVSYGCCERYGKHLPEHLDTHSVVPSGLFRLPVSCHSFLSLPHSPNAAVVS